MALSMEQIAKELKNLGKIHEVLGTSLHWLETQGHLKVMNLKERDELVKLIKSNTNNIKFISYSLPEFKINDGITYIDFDGKSYKLNIFGDHNLQNINGALQICNSIGITSEDFYKAITSFNGASNRLELIYKSSNSTIFKDFAHSPSKVKATSAFI